MASSTDGDRLRDTPQNVYTMVGSDRQKYDGDGGRQSVSSLTPSGKYFRCGLRNRTQIVTCHIGHRARTLLDSPWMYEGPHWTKIKSLVSGESRL